MRSLHPFRAARALAAAALLASPSIGAAQCSTSDSLLPPFQAPGLTRGGLEVATFDFAPLNAALARGGIPTIDETLVGYGFGGMLHFGRVRVSSRGHLLLPRTADGENVERRVAGGLGYLDVGYMLAPGPSTRITPQVGLGGAALDLRISDRHATPSFDDVIREPARGTDLRGRGFFASAGASVDHAMSFRGRGFVIGLHGGYRWELGDPRWSLFDASVGGGPALGLDGGYVQLSAGIPLRGVRNALLVMLSPIVTYGIR